MANQLKMDKVQAILALHAREWSNRKIATELGIHRTTVAACLKKHGSKPTKVPTGSEDASEEETEGSRSHCEPFRKTILEKLSQGLSAQRIYQDMVQEHAFGHGYDSVKRYVRKLQGGKELPFRRMECEAGEEVQIDFGQAAFVVNGEGKRQRPHLFRLVLSHSRKGYTEVVERQTTENFVC